MAKIQIGNTNLVKGAKGDDGLSAYEVAVNGGFVGTESEWLTSLEGANGTDGLGFTGGSYNASTGIVTFTSTDGLGFSTTDLRGATGATGAAGGISIALLSSHREDGKNSIDLVNKLISIYSFSSYILFSDDYVNSSISSDYILDYSAFTTGRWVILTYNRTKAQFEITDNIIGLQYPADNNYYVTSFYNSATTEIVALPLNADAFVIKENNPFRHEPVNWTALGDSHTDGAADYPAIVVDYFKTSSDFTNEFFNLTNLGLSGSHVTNNGANSFYQRRTQIPATTDLLTIFGGHNDHASEPIGTLATSSFNDATFIGAYQGIIEYALGLNADMRIVLIVPHRVYNLDVERDMSAFNQAIKDVAEYYGLPVLDLDADLGYNHINKESYLVNETPTFLHLNTNGINIVGKRVYEFIKSKY